MASAEASLAAHFARLNSVRRHAAVREQVFRASLNAISAGTVGFGVGVLLLLARRAMLAGSFTVGRRRRRRCDRPASEPAPPGAGGP